MFKKKIKRHLGNKTVDKRSARWYDTRDEAEFDRSHPAAVLDRVHTTGLVYAGAFCPRVLLC